MTNDPRARGFNYGAPIKLTEVGRDSAWRFLFWREAAEILRARPSCSDRSWELDMLVRDVRLACSFEEFEAKLAVLTRNGPRLCGKLRSFSSHQKNRVLNAAAKSFDLVETAA